MAQWRTTKRHRFSLPHRMLGWENCLCCWVVETKLPFDASALGKKAGELIAKVSSHQPKPSRRSGVDSSALSSDLLTYEAQNVRFWCRSGGRGGGRGGAALGRRAGEGKPKARSRTHREAHAQVRAGEDCRCLLEYLTEGLGGVHSISDKCCNSREVLIPLRSGIFFTHSR
jgi:hypothetical protein